MSLCKVKRTKKNKETYLETDYMYNDDNVGINLNTLLNTKTNRSMDINCLPISYSDNAFTSSGSGKINITSNIGLDNKDNLQFVFNITYPNRTDLQYVEVSDEEFANDMIQTCIIDKKNIKDIACYKQAFTSMVEQIKNSALEEDVLIKTNEINSKCFIYTEDLILLGTANRLLENSASKYVLGEYCGKKLTDYIDEYGDTTKLIIDMCVNKDITIQIKNIELVGATSSTMGYALIDMSNARIVRINNNHKDIEYKIPEGFVLPEYRTSYNYDNYYEQFLLSNSPTNIEKFYKLNKVSTNPTIDINRYLIW